MPFQVVQIVYWAALSMWFGGVLFIMVAAPVILRTLQENKPLLPHVLSVNLEGQHETLLAGTIIGNLISSLVKIELLCAGILLLTIGAQWLMLDMTNQFVFISTLIRSALFLAATVIVLYYWQVLWPKMSKFRQDFIDNADDPDQANPALENFNKCQRESDTLLYLLAACLVALVVLSGGMASPVHTFIPQTHNV